MSAPTSRRTTLRCESKLIEQIADAVIAHTDTARGAAVG